MNAGAANTGGRTPRGNVRANYYRPFTITVADGGRVLRAGEHAATFCAAGVDNGTCAFGIPAVGDARQRGRRHRCARRASSTSTLRSRKKFNFTET